MGRSHEWFCGWLHDTLFHCDRLCESVRTTDSDEPHLRGKCIHTHANIISNVIFWLVWTSGWWWLQLLCISIVHIFFYCINRFEANNAKQNTTFYLYMPKRYCIYQISKLFGSSNNNLYWLLWYFIFTCQEGLSSIISWSWRWAWLLQEGRFSSWLSIYPRVNWTILLSFWNISMDSGSPRCVFYERLILNSLTSL